jgi:hypothetical protein
MTAATITPTGFFDFGTIQPDRTPLTIKPKRPMLLRRYGEAQPRHADCGEVVTAAACDLATIDRHDFEILPG